VTQLTLRLLVAVHDVTPAHARRLDVLYHLLDELGVRRYALLVVPNWHGAWPLADYPEFAAALRERATREGRGGGGGGGGGTEIVLHGWRHDEVGLPRPVTHRLRTLGRTAREGEFASLPPVEAAARIARGIATLRDVGLEPLGFVPPAWLARPSLPQVVRDEGLKFTEDTRDLLLVNGRESERVPAPATCWSTRRRWRAAGSVVVAALRLRLERTRPLVRIALHPTDADVPGVLASCRRTLAALLERRVVTTYGELLKEPSGVVGRE
jgi:predicted deacetylase